MGGIIACGNFHHPLACNGWPATTTRSVVRGIMSTPPDLTTEHKREVPPKIKLADASLKINFLLNHDCYVRASTHYRHRIIRPTEGLGVA